MGVKCPEKFSLNQSFLPKEKTRRSTVTKLLSVLVLKWVEPNIVLLFQTLWLYAVWGYYLFSTAGFSVEGLISIQAPASHAASQSFAVMVCHRLKGRGDWSISTGLHCSLSAASGWGNGHIKHWEVWPTRGRGLCQAAAQMNSKAISILTEKKKNITLKLTISPQWKCEQNNKEMVY